jgi:hypothetical protein
VKIKAVVDGRHSDVYIVDIVSIESLETVVVQTGDNMLSVDEK